MEKRFDKIKFTIEDATPAELKSAGYKPEIILSPEELELKDKISAIVRHLENQFPVLIGDNLVRRMTNGLGTIKRSDGTVVNVGNITDWLILRAKYLTEHSNLSTPEEIEKALARPSDSTR